MTTEQQTQLSEAQIAVHWREEGYYTSHHGRSLEECR
jgi:hypothetical protein